MEVDVVLGWKLIPSNFPPTKNCWDGKEQGVKLLLNHKNNSFASSTFPLSKLKTIHLKPKGVCSDIR